MGCAVGTAVEGGSKGIISVGVNVGTMFNVGMLVGKLDGYVPSVGLNEGERVVGCIVGSKRTEGDDEKDSEGIKVGFIDGTSDGCRVDGETLGVKVG